MVVKMHGPKERTRNVPAAAMKPFHERSRDLWHPTEDEFAQQAWKADLGRTFGPKSEVPIYALVERKDKYTNGLEEVAVQRKICR